MSKTTEKTRKSGGMSRAALIVSVVALACGGLGGAVFTYFMNRQTPTILTYSITSTSIGADVTVKSVIPNLKISVGDEEIGAVHIHVIELTAQSGPYVDQLPIAIVFPHVSLRVFGDAQVVAPSPEHKINCKEQIENGRRCVLAPVDAKNGANKYRIVIATNSADGPTLVSAVQNVKLLSSQEFIERDRRSLGPFVLPFKSTDVLLGVASVLILFGTVVLLGSYVKRPQVEIVAISEEMAKKAADQFKGRSVL